MQEHETATQTAPEEVITPTTETIETPEIQDENSVAAEATPEAEPQVATEPEIEEEPEEVTYHAVQKEDGSVTAIWEMQGRKHLRTIDPRSREGAEILRLFTAEEVEETV